jgi:hypothetical protein
VNTSNPSAQPVDRVIETSHAFFLLRILNRPGVPDPTPDVNVVHARKGNTIIHRMIPDAGESGKVSSIYLRTPQLSIGMNNNPKQSIDLIPIPDATTRHEAQTWYDNVGKNFVDSTVSDYAIIRLTYEWLDDAIHN